MADRVLVIGAHCDDESFGCLGTLLKHKEAGDEISFLWFTTGRDCEDGATKCCRYFNVRKCGLLRLKDQRLDQYDFVKEIVKPIEEAIVLYVPTVIYCPFIGDLNRDHRIVAEATMVACRPYKEYAPREVWMYQIPGSTELGLREFRINRTENIDKELKEKLIREWYPEEMINGREKIEEVEHFERWPR